MLKITHEGLDFGEALKALKDRKVIKVPEWDGYWFLRGGQIQVRTHDGQVLDTPHFHPHIFREDWQVAESPEEAIKVPSPSMQQILGPANVVGHWEPICR